MPIDVYMQGPSIGDADIDAFELRLGRALPPDYRAFLLRTNGGRPNFHVIRNPAAGDVSVKIFYGTWDRKYFSPDSENKTMLGRWPDRFISIAIDDGGNCFSLSLGPPDHGSVYDWLHEEEAEPGEAPTEQDLRCLADSITNSWNRIDPIDVDVLSGGEGSSDRGPKKGAAPKSWAVSKYESRAGTGRVALRPHLARNLSAQLSDQNGAAGADETSNASVWPSAAPVRQVKLNAGRPAHAIGKESDHASLVSAVR